MTFASCLMLTGCLALLAAGCGTARRGEPFSARGLPADASLIRGAKTFYEHCHKCHTGGEAALGPAINDKPLPAFMMKLQVRRGLGAMPSFSEQEIGDEELDDLVAYLKALRHQRP